MVSKNKRRLTQAIGEENSNKQLKGTISKLKKERPIESPVARRLRSRNDVELLEGLPPRGRKPMDLTPGGESFSEEISNSNGHRMNEFIEVDSSVNTTQKLSDDCGDDSQLEVKSSGYVYCTIL